MFRRWRRQKQEPERPAPWPGSIREINDLPRDQKRAIYHTLIPDWAFDIFGVDRETHAVRGVETVKLRCPAGSNAVEISMHNAPESTEPALYLHMGDTFNSQLIVLLAVVNDPASPRYNIDVTSHGHPTQLGTDERNLDEETRALHAGLVPGQVRSGLRIFRTAVPIFETFVSRMGHELFIIEPLFYHNAITFERYGFAYSRGLQRMKQINADFAPGERLHARLDGSTPFRQPDAWQTTTGRSWAIHDGILDKPFTGIQMYRRIGMQTDVCTFPDARW